MLGKPSSRSVYIDLHQNQLAVEREAMWAGTSRERLTSQLNNQTSTGLRLDEQQRCVAAAGAGLELDRKFQVMLISCYGERKKRHQCHENSKSQRNMSSKVQFPP